MVSHREKVLLSELQSAQAGYPLRGKIEIEDGNVHVVQAIPARGTIWWMSACCAVSI